MVRGSALGFCDGRAVTQKNVLSFAVACALGSTSPRRSESPLALSATVLAGHSPRRGVPFRWRQVVDGSIWKVACWKLLIVLPSVSWFLPDEKDINIMC